MLARQDQDDDLMLGPDTETWIAQKIFATSVVSTTGIQVSKNLLKENQWTSVMKSITIVL